MSSSKYALDHLVLIGLDDVKDEARFFCRCHALSTFCLSTELWQKFCHAPLSSNMSLTLPFISQADFQILWVKVVQSIVYGILSILFSAILQTYETQIPITRMGSAVAGRCHSCITLSTSHTGRHWAAWHCTFKLISVMLLPAARSVNIFPIKITPPVLLSGECNCITCHRRI